MKINKYEMKLGLPNPIVAVADNPVIKRNLFVVTDDQKIHVIDLKDLEHRDRFSLSASMLDFSVPEDVLDNSKELLVRVSPSERFCAIANKYACHGIVIDLLKREPALAFSRDDYCVDYCTFSIDFFVKDGAEFLIHNT